MTLTGPTRTNRARRAVLAGCALLVGVLAACSSAAPAKTVTSQLNDQSGGGTYQGVGLDPAQPRPSFTLTDTAGKPYSFGERTGGHPTLLYFGYTTCPDVCPETMADISLALKSLPAALQRVTDVVFVSTDIKHDTGPIISKWLSNFAPNTTATFTGLRGTQVQVDAAQTAAHVTVAQDGGQTHSAEVLLYGSDDYARVSYPQSATEQLEIAHDVPLVAKV